MNIDSIRLAKEAVSEIKSWAEDLPSYLEDTERLIRAVQAMRADAQEDMDGIMWIYAESWNVLIDALQRVE